MGTINLRIAEEVIAGKYEDDQPTKIVTYNNMFNGDLTYALVCAHEDQLKYECSGACKNVNVYWTKKDGMNKNWAPA